MAHYSAQPVGGLWFRAASLKLASRDHTGGGDDEYEFHNDCNARYELCGSQRHCDVCLWGSQLAAQHVSSLSAWSLLSREWM